MITISVAQADPKTVEYFLCVYAYTLGEVASDGMKRAMWAAKYDEGKVESAKAVQAEAEVRAEAAWAIYEAACAAGFPADSLSQRV